MAANTLTGLIPIIYDARDIVMREITGLIMAVSRDATAAAAVDQTIRSPVVPAITPQAIVYGVSPVDEGEQTVTYIDMSLNKAYQAPIKWNGEEQVSLGSMHDSIVRDQFAQAFRGIVNLVEADLAALYIGACRAYGSAGTAPFASSHADVTAQCRKILDDNGVPPTDRHMIINTTAGANLRSLAGLNNVSSAGTDATLRQGLLIPLNGFDVRESAQIKSHTKGTMTGADCTAIEPVGETTVACDGSNSGTVLAGDVITRGNEGGSSADTNKYVVNSGSTLTGAASGNFILNKPGVKIATAVADEWTIGDSYTANMFFHRQAIHLATRQPAMPKGGDGAADVIAVSDPLTGITFQVAMYKLHRMVKFEIGLVWGCAVNKAEALGLLLG